MKKDNGFTLIELLAVITLIALLAVLIVPSIINLVTNNEDKLDNTTKELIFTATENYLDYNQNTYIKGEGAVYCITLEELIDKGFLEKDLKDISTGKTMEQWANDGYGIKSTYVKSLFKNKYEYNMLTSSSSVTDCINNEQYTPILNGIAIGDLGYYRYNTTNENNKRNKVYFGIDDMLVVVPI